ncbi:MAG TPA: hypothetical protein VFO26_11110 [Gaiella sp.]|uniref:hypothetical protein n=1 Tax=Gaiella sp. TaxID=2663207 RepID=UPI002D7E5613|nr:hypothetical protein [Gaiella sp.]HET9288098.1 hypothetical protein [Gaiella sp.]
MNPRPTAAELLAQGTLLDSGHFRELGLSERATQAVWRAVSVVYLPGFNRPLVPVEAYLALIAGNTYCDRCGDKVQPTRGGTRRP